MLRRRWLGMSCSPADSNWTRPVCLPFFPFWNKLSLSSLLFGMLETHYLSVLSFISYQDLLSVRRMDRHGAEQGWRRRFLHLRLALHWSCVLSRHLHQRRLRKHGSGAGKRLLRRWQNFRMYFISFVVFHFVSLSFVSLRLVCLGHILSHPDPFISLIKILFAIKPGLWRICQRNWAGRRNDRLYEWNNFALLESRIFSSSWLACFVSQWLWF